MKPKLRRSLTIAFFPVVLLLPTANILVFGRKVGKGWRRWRRHRHSEGFRLEELTPMLFEDGTFRSRSVLNDSNNPQELRAEPRGRAVALETEI